jgi:peptidoglycan hydrolase-like protein with peptidoglycan-binding domain
MQHSLRARCAWAVVVLAVLVAVPALLPGTAAAQDAGTAPGIDPALLADASWHGRPIQRPVPRATPVADRSPSLTRGTGYRTPTGSRRVRDLQRRLLRLGYRPGTRDGLYGPRTQAAVTAFQRKHGLEQDGSAGSETLALLRHRTAPGTTAEDPALTTQSQSQSQSQSRSRAPAPLAPAAATDDDGFLTDAIAVAIGALALLVLATRGLRRRREQPQAHIPPRAPVVAPATHEEPRIVRVAPHPRYLGPPWERRAALRERILAMKADGMSLQEIADRLTAEGVPTLGGVRRWQPWSVHAATRPTTPARHPAQGSRRHR